PRLPSQYNINEINQVNRNKHNTFRTSQTVAGSCKDEQHDRNQNHKDDIKDNHTGHIQRHDGRSKSRHKQYVEYITADQVAHRHFGFTFKRGHHRSDELRQRRPERDDGQTDQRLTHVERNRDFGGAGYDEFPAEYNADEPEDQNNNQSRHAKFLTFLCTIGFRRVIRRNRLRTLRFLKYVEHIK